MSYPWETVWEFSTAKFRVTLDVAPETHDPEDSFCDDADVEFAREGGWHWFQARVQVAFVDRDNPTSWANTCKRVLGEDYLGGCSYHGLKDFREGGYFRDMVSQAINEARGMARMASTVKVA